MSRNDYASFAQCNLRYFLEACCKNSKKAEDNKITQSARKSFPKSYFEQSLATSSHNPSKKSSSKNDFARAMFSEWRQPSQIGYF